MKHYNAELIAVGTELLPGNIANTDAQMLSEGLSALGIDVYYHTVVGDNPRRLREALEIARKRADVIITTGGLGPTYDDLTKQTICETFGRELVLHEDIWQGIQDYFSRRMHRPIPQNNIQQAYLPVNCTVFDNPVGTAPGCGFEEDGVHVLMLPGPPFECRYMFENRAVSYLQSRTDEKIFSHEIRIFGRGESQVEEDLHVLLHGGDGDEFEAAVGVLVAGGQVGAGEAPVGEGGAVGAAPEGHGAGREPG